MRTRDPGKQQRIKESMIRLVLKEGMGGASVAKIAKDAGVSPATIYIYYSSKEEMMAEVFSECAHQSYKYLLDRLRPEMDGAELIDGIVRGYFSYTVEHEEVFSFVEQCSRCPTVAEEVCEEECCCGVFDLLHEYQNRGIVKRYSDPGLAAVLFAPVRFIAANAGGTAEETEARLRELSGMLQDLLLL